MLNKIPHILVVDDHEDMLVFMRKCLTQEGYNVTTCSSGIEAVELFQKSKDAGFSPAGEIDIVLSDVKMPQLDGVALLKTIHDTALDVPVVLMTAFGTIEDAVKAMRLGAYDYLTKPFKLDDVRQTLKRAIEFRRGTVPKNKAPVLPSDLIGSGQRMIEIFSLVRRLSNVQSNVLLLGESGSGKEVLAQAIHKAGRLASKPFIAINCAAIPEELLESELFGHAKGSFTGATVQKTGLFEEAEGGTLFLDEMGDMPLSLQAKLLRVIQERKIRPVGSNISKQINVRLISATHRDLRTAIRDGKFREDLFFRLSVVPIALPPLRERKEDIPLFVDFFLKKFSKEHGTPFKTLSPEALNFLMNLKWEGNVRQLGNAVERAVVLTQGATIDTPDLAFLQESAIDKIQMAPTLVEDDSLNMRDVEKKAVILALAKAGGKKEVAAQILGISRKTLYRKEKEFNLA